MLEVRALSVSYGQHRALEDVSVQVAKGEIVVILGANGAGKSTLLRAISGICEGQARGAVDMDGHGLLGLSSDRIVERGVALVPEGRGIFGDLTVRENLVLGAYAPARAMTRPPISNASWGFFQSSVNARAKSRAPCRAANSRWWRSGAR